MALPEQRDESYRPTPPAPRDDIPNRVQDVVEPPRKVGFFRPLFWVLFAIVIGLVIWWAATAYQGNRGNPNATLQPNRVHPTEAVVIRNIGLLATVPNNHAMIGRGVQLQDAHVIKVMGDHKFWVGGGPQRVFVFVPDNVQITGAQDHPSRVAVGTTVFVNGWVEPAPPAQQAERQWGISPTDADEVVRDQLYIKADRVQNTGTSLNQGGAGTGAPPRLPGEK